MRVGSLILAGGRSVRMGQPKESLPFLGHTLLGRTAMTLFPCTAPVVIVARDAAQPLGELPVPVLVTVDTEPAKGPLAALVQGLRFLKEKGFGDADAAFATGCDAPFLTANVVTELVQRLGDAALVMPRASGILQPLCAVYRVSVLGAAETLLGNGIHTPRALANTVAARELDEHTLRQIDPELRFLRNVNTPEEYQRALDEANRPSP